MGMAFLSYSRDDNRAENNRIIALAKAITKEYGLQTGDELELFIDEDSIKVGDKWKEEIEKNLGSAIFFIAIITPRYFNRFQCREELRFFIDKAETLGDRKLVLPILYANVPELHSDDTADQYIQFIKSIQWIDWTEKRLDDLDSSQNRKEIYKLALRLAEINKALDNKSKQTQVVTEDDSYKGEIEQVDDELGTIEKIADLEESINNVMQDLLNQITERIGNVTNLISASTEEMLSNPKYTSYSYRANVLKNLSGQLWPDVHAMQKLTETYVKETGIIDDGLRALIGMIADNITSSANLSEKPTQGEIESIKGLLDVIETYSKAVIESMVSIQGMINETSQIEKLSRAIRPVLSTLRKSLNLMVDTTKLATEWQELVDTTKSSIGTL